MNSELEKTKSGYIDFISGIVLLVFSTIVFVYGIYIINTMNLGKGVEWYTSPALMPLFIGAIIGILSILLIIKNKTNFIEYLKNNKNNSKVRDQISIKDAIMHYRENQLISFVITLVLLIFYIFVFIGRMPFVLATFLYLVLNMIIFREKGFAIWKLVIISIVMSVLINYGFGIVAKIPLP